MLPETDRSNLAYDLSMYDNAARREQEREQERERERRARQIKMNTHTTFPCTTMRRAANRKGKENAGQGRSK